MIEIATYGITGPTRGLTPRLRGRVVLIIAAVIVAACAGAGTLLFWRALDERQAIRDRALTTAVALSFGFDQEVAAVNYLLKGLSASPALRSGDTKAFYDQLKATPVPEGSWLMLHDYEGQVLNTLRPFGSPLPRHAEIPNRQEVIERIRDRGWAVSGRLPAPVKGSVAIALSLRIDGPDGQMQSWITTILAEARLNALLDEHKVPGGWAKGVYDRNFKMIVAEQDGAKALELCPPTTLTDQIPSIGPHETSSGLIEAAGQDGTPVLVAYRRSGPTNWTTTVVVPLALVNRPVNGVLWQMAGPVAFLLLAGCLAAWLMTREVERPLHALSNLVSEAKGEVAQLSEQLLTLQGEERQRIARELHDSTAQHIVAASLGLARLERETSRSAIAPKIMADVDALLERALAELRIFTYLLHPPNLAEDGFRATLEEFIHGFAGRAGLKARVQIADRVDDVPLDIQTSMLRVVQEALANVHRHATASEVHVAARLNHRRLVVRVRDDGHGMVLQKRQDADGHLRLGVGIPGMRARLRQFGGELRIKSGPWGTALLAAVPYTGMTAAYAPRAA